MKIVVCNSTIEEAVANLSGAMEADTISKNGRSSFSGDSAKGKVNNGKYEYTSMP